MNQAKAYYSPEHGCWFVPVSSALFNSPDLTTVEHARVELTDGQLVITQLDRANPMPTTPPTDFAIAENER